MKVKQPQSGSKRNQSPGEPKWAKVLVENTSIKPAMKRILADYYGANLTLGAISSLPWSEVLALPGAGRVAAESCVAAISHAMRKPYTPVGPTLLDMASK